jgi:L-serine dehydratase
MLSVLDLFRIGIGPSSSHTLGPMRIGKRFLEELPAPLDRAARVCVELQGSLALTGKGHATPKAVMLGLSGAEPETLDPDEADAIVAAARETMRLILLGRQAIDFDPDRDIVFAYDVIPELHPNGMTLTAFDATGAPIFSQTYYSTGGGFIATEKQLRLPAPNDQIVTGREGPFPFVSGADFSLIVQRSRKASPTLCSPTRTRCVRARIPKRASTALRARWPPASSAV